MSIISSSVRFLAPKVVQPDAPHRGSIESELCVQTNALAFRFSGTTRTFAYPEMSKAPVATITDWNTWTDFRFPGSGTPWFQPAWFIAKQYTQVTGRMFVTYSHSHALAVRLVSSQCVSSIVVNNGANSDIMLPTAVSSARETGWLSSERPNRYQASVDLQMTDYSATRRLGIWPQIQIVQVNAASPFPAGDRYAYLTALVLHDRHLRQDA